jgi:hypothetical protein
MTEIRKKIMDKIFELQNERDSIRNDMSYLSFIDGEIYGLQHALNLIPIN